MHMDPLETRRCPICNRSIRIASLVAAWIERHDVPIVTCTCGTRLELRWEELDTEGTLETLFWFEPVQSTE